MARWLTVLVALVAQGMALMSPVCLVRCVSPSGHECIELAGQDCHCCDSRSHEDLPQVCAVATCGHHHEDEQDQEHDAPTGWQVRCEHCACQHSPLEAGQQVQTKSLSAYGRSPSPDFLPALTFVATIEAWNVASLSASGGLRPQESPHLAVMATVVLRL